MKYYRPLMILVMSCVFSLGAFAQKPANPTSIDIYHDLKKLEVVGSAMYLAAHPDDENTRVIAYLSNHLNIPTTYLSLTRGDGGQNLIGTEIREELGVLRTQELLAARRTDGGSQRFTRANDFGYSKSPEETKEIWNKDAVLGDMVWNIRKLRPDVIVNRFSHDSGRRTHGHHTSSAQLSVEAYDLAGDPSAYPEQLKYVQPWQPRRLFFNTSWWFYGSREKFAEADKSKMIPVDIGVYYPLRGKSNTEIASESRSKHRCQGFGSTSTRGSQTEYLQLIRGDMPGDASSPIAEIDMSWSRLSGGEQIEVQLASIIEKYDFADPAASLADLLSLRKAVRSLGSDDQIMDKLADLDQIILDCAGLYAELRTEGQYRTRGETVGLDLEVISRAQEGIVLESVSFSGVVGDSTLQITLPVNENQLVQFRHELPATISDRSPYWLREEGTLGMYAVADPTMIGLPENPDVIHATLVYSIAGQQISQTIPAVYTSTDPAIGQEYFPFDVLPRVTAGIEKEVYVFGNDVTRDIQVKLTSHRPEQSGVLRPIVSAGWKVEPARVDFSTTLRGEVREFTFQVTPPAGQSELDMKLEMTVDGEMYNQSLTVIDYEHIPRQIILGPAAARLVKVDLKRAGDRIGYIMGAGDKVPENLEQIGYQVDLLTESDITAEGLAEYDAIMVGIRALNTQKWLPYKNSLLLDYVKDGGTLVHQYNTNRRLVMEDFSPYPLQLSRGRVTKEEAEVRILAPEHPVINTPNEITSADFDHWVQERGLYFPGEWSEEYTAILSSNDPGEEALDGGLLIAEHGDGYFVYSGYSWFRQLPAGVPGAFRLLANILSLGSEERP